MAIRVALQHRTSYRFDRPVMVSPHEIRLRPAPHCRTPVLGYSLNIEPAKNFLNWQQDPYGNWVARVVFPEPATSLDIVVDLVADMTVINPFDFFVEPYAEFYPFKYANALAKELIPFLDAAPAGPRLSAWLTAFRATLRADEKTVDMLVRLNRELQHEIRYLVRMEPGVQTPEETFDRAQGSCRDTGWLLVQILRHLGLAARFASGYLIQLAADVKSLDGPSGTDKDFTDLHAWAEVYLPGAGWIGLDPTSGLLAGEGHLPLACTADPGNAAPVVGFTDPCDVEFLFAMSITRVHEDPRVTKPYSDAQWADIDALGHRVDADLAAHGVRLTQGGEPTFVSIDDMDGAEWNFAALSPKKRELAEVLLRRLAKRFAPGGFLHMGQGKWYPGEPLPRWAIGVYWRDDGIPLWRDPALIADTRADGDADIGDAQRVALEIAGELGLDPAYVMTAYEDAPSLLVKESALPPNVDPLQADLSKPAERARLARLLQRGLERPVGFILPLKASQTEGTDFAGWSSSPWPLRRERLYALAGDSPLGLRLPLSSLPDVLPEDEDIESPVDPFAPRGDLPEPEARTATATGTKAHRGAIAPREVVKTALCVEMRDGHVFVFMPPLKRLEDYVVLLASVERAAARVGRAVAIEGYTPPRDPRITVLNVTPDPGVIEVNIHPASTWDEFVDDDRDPVRRSAAIAARHRKVHAGWPSHGHGRRQPRHPRRRDARGQSAAAPPRPVAKPHYLLAEPPLVVLYVLGNVRWPDKPGAACGRSARRPPLRTRDRVPATDEEAPGGRRDRIAVAHRPAVASPADGPDRQHAPLGILHRQALFARYRRRAGSASSNSARSKCRRTPA